PLRGLWRGGSDGTWDSVPPFGAAAPSPSEPEAPMKRLLFVICALTLLATARPSSAGWRVKLAPANARPAGDTRALWLQAPGRVDTVFHHDSTRVRRDSAAVDSTVRDSTRPPRPTPPPQRPRQRPRPRVVYLG